MGLEKLGTIRAHEMKRKYRIYVESSRNKTATYHVQQNGGEGTAFTVFFFVTFVGYKRPYPMAK
jgi:hypothetical protein